MEQLKAALEKSIEATELAAQSVKELRSDVNARIKSVSDGIVEMDRDLKERLSKLDSTVTEIRNDQKAFFADARTYFSAEAARNASVSVPRMTVLRRPPSSE